MPNKVDFERDMVYLYQFPRPACSPNLSPYCLKVETWLRMADIPYKTLSNDFKIYSSKHQVPFVELNGNELPDSGMIIKELANTFSKRHLEPAEPTDKAVAVSFDRLIEGSLVWCMITYRSKDPAKRLLAGFMNTGKAPWYLKMASPALAWKVGSQLRNKVYEQGYGRLTEDELKQVYETDLLALSHFLKDKPFLMGDEPTSLDATAFGTLCQFYYAPDGDAYAVKQFIDKECANLVEYMERIKSKYWPDWQKVVGEYDQMTSDWKEKKNEE